MSTVSDLIADTLVASGIRRVYGIPGDSLNGFTDALRAASSRCAPAAAGPAIYT